MQTQYYIDSNGNILGPMYSGQYRISGGFIYGPNCQGEFRVDSGGNICDRSGALTGFRVYNNSIWGDSDQLPWFK